MQLNNMQQPLKQSGFTVIELLVVIAIIALLVTVVSLPFANFRKTQALENSANGLVAVFNEARTRTLAATNGTNYSVRIEPTRAILFEGSSYSASASSNEVFSYDEPVTAAHSFTGGGSSVTFDRLRGTTSQPGTITLESAGATRVITVSTTGAVMRN
jgi:prepilin-type N-terminal cleavage/methylation domain-containing protein